MIRALEGCRVLVVEDELLIAMDVADSLEEAGASVVGPTSSIEGATSLLRHSKVKAAVLDIRLRKQLVYPLADALAAQDIPYVFISGLDDEEVPEKYLDVPLCHKPFGGHYVARMLAGERQRRALAAGAREIAA
jgi:CheY-like chemotaxis protein